MAGIVVRNIERAPLDIVDGLGACGVATVHEAQGRTGLLAQPHAADLSRRADRRHARSPSRAPPGDNWMIHVAIEQVQRGRHPRRSRRPVPARTAISATCWRPRAMARGCRGLVIEAGVRDVRDLNEMGFPVWSKAIFAQGTIKATLGIGQRADRLRRRRRSMPGDVIVADDDGVCVVRARRRRRRARQGARPRGERGRQAQAACRPASSASTCTTCASKLEAHGPEICLTEAACAACGCAAARPRAAISSRRICPPTIAERDAFLLRVMGSPDPRQIDGMGGADPLTIKVAIVSEVGARRGVDVDYLFLQVFVDQAIVTDAPELRQHPRRRRPVRDRARAGRRARTARRGSASSWRIPARSRSRRSRRRAAGSTYEGDARIDGVPGTAAPVPLEFRDTAGSSCGALLPTGNAVDEIDGVAAP